jgi:LysR family transcriptional regulator, transcriptional activator of the cysJI operon
MEDYRLKVFYSVTKNQSFTKAAAELFITQPAITKHIKLLEEDLGIRLFERKGSYIFPTAAGDILFKYASEIFRLYKEAQFEIGTLKNEQNGKLRLGASTTIAQYLISAVLASFYEKFPSIELNLLNGNTELIENAVLNKTIDLGIVEGKKHLPGLKYIDFMEDELVAVVHYKSKFFKNKAIELSDLKNIPTVLRERGSGTLEVIESALKERDIKLSNLQILMHLGSTQSIKSFLEHSNAMSFISIRAIEQEVKQGVLKIIEINDFRILRNFSFVNLQGQQDSLSTSFIRFALRHYNQK